MSAQHTPGPWTMGPGFTIMAYGSVDTYDGPVWGSIGVVSSLSETDSDGRTFTAGGDREANARLITAAPEMREALLAAEIALTAGNTLDQRANARAIVRAVLNKLEDWS